MLIWIIFIGLTIVSYIISATLKAKFDRYSKLPMAQWLTGKDVAEMMLADHGINDVKVVSIGGYLTDHYNPVNKTINLSRPVYSEPSIAAAAVAAHETGHAIQHARAYSWLMLRSALVPVVSITSRWLSWILLLGIITVQTFPYLLFIGIILFSLNTLFSFITLPVEIDASRRALKWLQIRNMVPDNHYIYARDALKWAAYTYVIAALTSLATLLYYILIFISARDE